MQCTVLCGSDVKPQKLELNTLRIFELVFVCLVPMWFGWKGWVGKHCRKQITKWTNVRPLFIFATHLESNLKPTVHCRQRTQEHENMRYAHVVTNETHQYFVWSHFDMETTLGNNMQFDQNIPKPFRDNTILRKRCFLKCISSMQWHFWGIWSRLSADKNISYFVRLKNGGSCRNHRGRDAENHPSWWWTKFSTSGCGFVMMKLKTGKLIFPGSHLLETQFRSQRYGTWNRVNIWWICLNILFLHMLLSVFFVCGKNPWIKFAHVEHM